MRETIEFGELCARLDGYVDAVAAGGSFIIACNGVEIADLIPRRVPHPDARQRPPETSA